MSLVEFIVVLAVMSGIILFISASLIFFVNQTQANLERNNIYTELNYAVDDMKLRCVSADQVSTVFSSSTASASGRDTKNELVFQGEQDIYTVTPDVTTDNTWYKYYLTNADTSTPPKQDLVIKTCTDSSCASGSEEILIDKVFNPSVSFIYEKEAPPNMLKVVLTAESSKVPLGADKQVTKEGSIRFWFVDIAQ